MLALTARDAGCRASSLLGVEQRSSAALSFDLACEQRLFEWENDREWRRAKLHRKMMRAAVAEGIVMYMGGEVPKGDDDELDDEKVSDDDLL